MSFERKLCQCPLACVASVSGVFAGRLKHFSLFGLATIRAKTEIVGGGGISARGQ